MNCYETIEYQNVSNAEKSSIIQEEGRMDVDTRNRFEYILNFRPNSGIFSRTEGTGNHKIWKEPISQQSLIAERK